MKWMLVYIIVQVNQEPIAINAMGTRYTFDSMVECFKKREELGDQLTGRPGHFEINSQAVCMRVSGIGE